MSKNITRIFCVAIFVAVVTLLPKVSAQEPPHPPQTGHGTMGNQAPGGTARIGDGGSILIAFALAYGYRRIRQIKRKHETLVRSHNGD
jgi:hypothetical protein